MRGSELSLDLNVIVDLILVLDQFSRQTTLPATCFVLATAALSAVLETDSTCTTAAIALRLALIR